MTGFLRGCYAIATALGIRSCASGIMDVIYIIAETEAYEKVFVDVDQIFASFVEDWKSREHRERSSSLLLRKDKKLIGRACQLYSMSG
jgi:hypothetical protein